MFFVVVILDPKNWGGVDNSIDGGVVVLLKKC